MRFASLALAALCLLVLFTGLGRPGAIDQREARDAQVARELAAQRELLTPKLGLEAWLEKPLLAYLPEVLLRFVAPDTPLAARLLKAALALALVLLTVSVGARHFGARAGLFAGLVLASSLALPVAVRSDGTQLLGSLLGWIGCAGLADAVFGRAAGREPRLVVTYVAIAAALLCAGPLPAAWPCMGFALYARLARTPDARRLVRPLPGLAIVIGLALPWYGAMTELHGAEFLRHAPFFPYAAEARGPWYASLVLPFALLAVGAFPWSTLLPAAMLHAAAWWRFTPRARQAGAAAPARAERPTDPLSREQREETAAHFFIAALLAALVPVVLYPGPPLPASLPALPAVALLCGRWLDHLFEDPPRLNDGLGYATRMLWILGGVGAVLLVLLAPRVPEASQALRLLGAAVLLASSAPYLARLIGRPRLSAVLIAAPVAVGAPIATLRVLPAMEGYLNTREVVAALDVAAPARAPLVLIEPPPPSLRLYVGRNLVTRDPAAGELASLTASGVTLAGSDGHVYLAFRPAREHEVARALAMPLEIMLRTPTLVLARVRPG